jgi:serine protease Do
MRLLISRWILTLIILLSLLLNFSCFRVESEPQKRVLIGSEKQPAIPNPGPMGSVFSTIASNTIPTVVSVIPTKFDTVIQYNNPFDYFFGDTSSRNPFNFFFGPQAKGQGRQKGKPPFEERQYRVQALGSGVIISGDGLILSNYHVIQGAQEIEVLLSDGRSFPASIIGSDSLADVAVIKIKGKVSDLPVAYFGNSDSLLPGDWVMAVGNPFALTSTVTVGVVSALNRQVESPNKFENYIQTDAAINPGNSGGALVNLKGELVGINSMIYTQTGGFMGIGFAVPINMARRDAEDLISKGRVIRGWIGASIQDISQTTSDALGLSSRNGALVADVIKGQPADQAGIIPGDVIVSVNDKPVRNASDLRNKVAEIKPGDTVPVTVIRQGKEQKLKITIVERTNQRVASGQQSPPSAEQPSAKATETFGIDVTDLTTEIRQKLGITADVNGVIVTEISSSVTDERTAIKPDDVIERIKIKGSDFQNIKSVSQFKTVAQQTKKDDPVLLLIARGNSTFIISFKAP